VNKVLRLKQVVYVCIHLHLRFKMSNLINLSKFKMKADFASANEYGIVNFKIFNSYWKRFFLLNQIIMKQMDGGCRLKVHKTC
jgi:hypothetical protein